MRLNFEGGCENLVINLNQRVPNRTKVLPLNIDTLLSNTDVLDILFEYLLSDQARKVKLCFNSNYSFDK